MPRSPHVAKLVRFPPELWARLVEAARREHRSVTLQIIHYVEAGLDRSERRHELPRVADTPAEYDPHGGEEPG